MKDHVNLDDFLNDIRLLMREANVRGIPHTLVHRLDACKAAAYEIERARQAQDRTNG